MINKGIVGKRPNFVKFSTKFMMSSTAIRMCRKEAMRAICQDWSVLNFQQYTCYSPRWR